MACSWDWGQGLGWRARVGARGLGWVRAGPGVRGGVAGLRDQAYLRVMVGARGLGQEFKPGAGGCSQGWLQGLRVGVMGFGWVGARPGAEGDGALEFLLSFGKTRIVRDRLDLLGIDGNYLRETRIALDRPGLFGTD